MTFILLFFAANQATSQIRFGALGGLNMANMKILGASEEDLKTKPSFNVGGVVEYNFSESFGIQSGLFLSGKGTRYEFTREEGGLSNSIKSSISPMYLEIPVNAMYKINLGTASIQLFAGPYIGIGVGGNVKSEVTTKGTVFGVPINENETNTSDIKYGSSSDSNFKRTDFGLNIGAGVEFSKILIRAQYGLGLSNIDASNDAVHNRVIGISAGYMFGGN